MLLVSVFTKEQKEVDFSIEASQSLTKLDVGSSKLGYVEKGSEMIYEVISEPNTESIVTLSSFH